MARCLVGIAVALFALPAQAQTRSENWALCQSDDVNSRILACSVLIMSGQEDANSLAHEHYNRGLAYRQKGDNNSAFADYTQAIALRPNFANAYFNRGNIEVNAGLYDQAIADFSQSIAFNPNDAEGYVNRAWAYEKLGRRNEAIADLRAALNIDPNQRPAIDGLTRLGVAP